MSNCKLIWATPDADEVLAYIARVSNPDNQDNPSIERLLNYMMENGHTSPFEMVSACIEINTTRDIGRQILRHRSFSFQEFSQRYQDVSKLPEVPLKECRLQDKANRQSSYSTDDISLREWWNQIQREQVLESQQLYQRALERGIAKEVARVLLPEGLTPTRMYMVGNFRSWIFYLKSRLDKTTQKEHRLLAEEILTILRSVAPVTMNTFFKDRSELNE